MKKIYDIASILVLDLSTDIPILLANEELDEGEEKLEDFNSYVIGGSKEAEEKSLCVYHDDLGQNVENNGLSMIIQAQLYREQYDISLRYLDIIKDYLKDYPPEKLGMNILERMEVDTWELERDQTTFIYFILTYSEDLDSCD